MRATFSEAAKAVQEYGTRNPFELLESIGAIIWITYDFEPDGLKGFATIMNDISYAGINGNLPEQDMLIAAGHEAAHLILHKNEILNSPAYSIKDFNLYDNSGKLEFEANSFLADFLVSDEQVMDVITNPDRDYFSAAKELCIPPDLLAFKLYSMIRRGFNLINPAVVQSRFLKKGGMW